MPLPLIPVAVVAGSSLVSVITGAGINKLTGTKNTRKTVLYDALLGATPVTALVGAGKAARTGYKFRRYIPAGKPTMQTLGSYTHKFGGYITPIATKPEFYAGVALTMAIQSKPAWMSVIRKKQLKTAIDVFDKSKESESPSQSLTSRRKGGKTSRSFSKQTGDGPKDSRSRGKTYCKRHRQYDFCKKYNILK